jgi:hypothetical protein
VDTGRPFRAGAVLDLLARDETDGAGRAADGGGGDEKTEADGGDGCEDVWTRHGSLLSRGALSAGGDW